MTSLPHQLRRRSTYVLAAGLAVSLVVYLSQLIFSSNPTASADAPSHRGTSPASVISGTDMPYVLAQYAQNANGVAQPMVVGPDGTVVVNSSGVIQDAAAGTVGSTTQTDGLQEAINYAVAKGLDVYIAGGSSLTGTKANNNVYFLNKTLTIPAAQDFRIDGGESVINYNPTSGDAMTIDSCEDCHFRFGLVVTGATNGSAVAFRPTNQTPLDHLTVITDSTFEFSSIATSKSTGTSAYAVNLDATNGPILWNDFNITATVGFQTNVRLYSANSTNASLNNTVRVIHNHQATTSLVSLSTYSNDNRFVINDDRNASTGVGIDVYSNGNSFNLQSSGFPSGEDIIFENGATSNLVLAVGSVSYTDHNSTSQNKVVTGTP